MTTPDRWANARTAGALLMARCVDNDRHAEQQLLDELTDPGQVRYVLSVVLIIVNNLLVKDTARREAAISEVLASLMPATPGDELQ